MGILNVGSLFASRTKPEDVEELIKSPGLQENDPFSQRFNQTAKDQLAYALSLRGYGNNGAQAESAAQHQALISQLMQQANGQGPSVAQAFLNNALDQQMANTNSLAASSRGNTNPVLAQRMAMEQNAQASQQTAQMANLAKMQEQLQAQGLANNALTNMRGQDIQNAATFGQLGLGYEGVAANNAANGLNAANANLTAEMNARTGNANIAAGETAGQNVMTQKIAGGTIEGIAKVGAAIAGGSKPGAYTGGVIPGRSKVNGDSPNNDTVPAMLSPGEIVIPKSMASDAEKAKAFVDHLMSSKSKASDKTGYAQVLEAKRILQDMNKRLKKIESKVGAK